MELVQDGHFWLIKDGDVVVSRVTGSRRFAVRVLERFEQQAEKEKEAAKKVSSKKKATKKASKKKVSKKK